MKKIDTENQILTNKWGIDHKIRIFENKGDLKGTLIIADGRPIDYTHGWFMEEWTLKISRKLSEKGYKVCLIDNSYETFKKAVNINKKLSKTDFSFLIYSRENIIMLLKYFQKSNVYFMGVSWGTIIWQSLPSKYKLIPSILREVIPGIAPRAKQVQKGYSFNLKNWLIRNNILNNKHNNIRKIFVGDLDKISNMEMIRENFHLKNQDALEYMSNSDHSLRVIDNEGNFLINDTLRNYDRVEEYILKEFLK